MDTGRAIAAARLAKEAAALMREGRNGAQPPKGKSEPEPEKPEPKGIAARIAALGETEPDEPNTTDGLKRSATRLEAKDARTDSQAAKTDGEGAGPVRLRAIVDASRPGAC